MQENREFQDFSCEAISSSFLQNNIKNLIMNYCCHGEFFYATWSKISFFPQRHSDGREGFKIKQRDFSLICPEKKHPTQTLSWCYHSCHGDRIRQSQKTGGNWFISISLWCQTQRRTVNRDLLLPPRADRGSQRAVLRPRANLISDAATWSREQSHFLMPHVAM